MIFTAFMLLATAQAQPAPKATTSPAATAAASRVEQIKATLQKAGMSPAGITRLTTDRPQLKTQLQALAQQLNQVNAQLKTALGADVPDVTQIATILRRRDDAAASLQRLRTNETVTVLGDLSPADRKIYIRMLTSQNAAAAQNRPTT